MNLNEFVLINMTSLSYKKRLIIKIGPDNRIWTYDPIVPSDVLYQTELYPDYMKILIGGISKLPYEPLNQISRISSWVV